MVPQRARGCPALKYAIFAVAVCHLARNPRYVTDGHITYYGQTIDRPEPSVALEYVLRCIANLSKTQPHDDSDKQENMITAAVILRQYEELEVHTEPQINFLTIIKSIIANTAPSIHPDQLLAEAAFWTAVRQEIYNSFVEERAFDLSLPFGQTSRASPVNKMVVLAAEVTRWRWSSRSVDEYCESIALYYALLVIANVLPASTIEEPATTYRGRTCAKDCSNVREASQWCQRGRVSDNLVQL